MQRSQSPRVLSYARPIAENETRIHLIRREEDLLLVAGLLLVIVLLLGG